MSIELALLPIAIAIAGAIAAAGTARTLEQWAQNDQSAFSLSTRIKDAQLLEAALENYGCRTVTVGEAIKLGDAGQQIIFAPNAEGVFDAVFMGNISRAHAERFVFDIYEQYTQQVQQQVYQNLLARAKDRGMKLESETFQEDNSIVLTFVVGG